MAILGGVQYGFSFFLVGLALLSLGMGVGTGVGLALLSGFGLRFGGGILGVDIGSGGTCVVLVPGGRVGNVVRVGTAL